MANRLAGESSPYLLQHKDNPVDWYPWGEAALARAREEQKPIFLSIGYSACHWCHVMEHESFEDKGIAHKLNESFVCIKVDREERPDVDQIYMNAVQILTGHGGWPMSVFLTPDLKPFFGGTYWPPHAGRGMPGFDQVIDAVNDAWENRREQAIEGASNLTERLHQLAHAGEEHGELSFQLLQQAAARLERSFDHAHGGFGGAPKFPHSMDLQVLLRYWRRQRRDGVLDMVRLTLDRMAAGGIYDHLGGGFARYSVDARWLVPHFEKMLYDNALLVRAYLDGLVVTGNADYGRVVRETLDYVLRDMTDPQGGFYSTEDADSEGEEGKFYLWTPGEVREVLGEEAAKTFCYCYDVTDEGNFEGKNILNLPKTLPQCASMLDRDLEELKAELAESRRKLFAVREKRTRPGRDDKVLVSWNGLMIASMARAGMVLEEPKYVQAARRAADFILEQMRSTDGRLLHTWRGGTAKLAAYLDDYMALVDALISVHEASGEPRLVEEAVGLANLVLELFRDKDRGGFFYTASDHEPLITRNKDVHDASVPSGNALAATALLRLGSLTGRTGYHEAAVETLHFASHMMEQMPTATGQMLLALDMHLGPMREIALVGEADATAKLAAELERRFVPNKVVSRRAPGASEASASLESLFAGKEAVGGKPAAYICENFACQAPVAGEREILAAWDRLASES